jgi:hypothetical protein
VGEFDYVKSTLGLNQQDIDELLVYWTSSKKEVYEQNYNVFRTTRVLIPKEEFGSFGAIKKICSNKLMEGQEIKSAYFLKYFPGSFTALHDDFGTSRTVITMVSANGLVGGENIINIPYIRKDNTSLRKGKDRNGKPIVPKVVPMAVGESLVYGPKLLHGVCQIEKGTRIILACWFKQIEKETQ